MEGQLIKRITYLVLISCLWLPKLYLEIEEIIAIEQSAMISTQFFKKNKRTLSQQWAENAAKNGGSVATGSLLLYTVSRLTKRRASSAPARLS